MTYRELMDLGMEKLSGSTVLVLDEEDVQSDCWWLFSAACQMDRPQFLFRKNESALKEECTLFLEWIQRRMSGEPVAYILGEWEFMGLPFKTTPAVLIPRQDTETLVEAAIEKVAQMIREKELKQFRILDMCTGSGCILISLMVYLKKQFPSVELIGTAVDLSEEALNIAHQNASINHVSIEFLKGNMFEALQDKERHYDLIVSNPPYIDAPQMKTLPVDVARFEPEMALAGGEDGLCFYRILAEKSAAYLAEGGSFFWEIGEEQADSTKHLIENEKELQYIQCLKDYGGNDRVVEGERR